MYVFLDLWRCVNGFMEILMVGGHFSYERTYNTIFNSVQSTRGWPKGPASTPGNSRIYFWLFQRVFVRNTSYYLAGGKGGYLYF
ncbi:uncharacterized protein YALI1_A16145g [Yarrowia lipolytica]|uniref:Uncharacterized protein n=1 Tax=Yarrowia lipolytica TaxID=4952 RepID=A0A1D8N508_YARLL|nr:hypothetical protein YALI1_A16145g [Yarrowia lipolytica]